MEQYVGSRFSFKARRLVKPSGSVASACGLIFRTRTEPRSQRILPRTPAWPPDLTTAPRGELASSRLDHSQLLGLDHIAQRTEGTLRGINPTPGKGTPFPHLSGHIALIAEQAPLTQAGVSSPVTGQLTGFRGEARAYIGTETMQLTV